MACRFTHVDHSRMATLDDLLSVLQGASNSAASTVSAPVDGINWILKKAGFPVSDKPVGGSDWLKDKGLMAEPKNQNLGYVGEAIGGVAPMLVGAYAPQIASKLNQMGANLAAPRTLNPQAGIVSVGAAKGLATKRALPSDDLFTQAVSGTPGAQITEDGLLMRLQRNQAPEQSLRPSVRGGVFYLPEGAAQAKHYSTGKSWYGGAEKITGETLIANPMFVKGATGGKAPEAAYDTLVGKGAYQAMRTDALKAYGGYGAPASQKVERVGEFLSQYAPELEDQAYNIVQNSKVGNQLAYALQEAAVGSKVRSAGHDAVLGYSKGKAGPFLSEVFDVREMNYPDKFGTPTDIWDVFER